MKNKRNRRHNKEKYSINKFPLLDLGLRKIMRLKDVYQFDGKFCPYIDLNEKERVNKEVFDYDHYSMIEESEVQVVWATSETATEDNDDTIDFITVKIHWNKTNDSDFVLPNAFNGYGVGNTLWFETVCPFREQLKPYASIVTSRNINQQWRNEDYEYKSEEQELVGDIWNNSTEEEFYDIFPEN